MSQFTTTTKRNKGDAGRCDKAMIPLSLLSSEEFVEMQIKEGMEAIGFFWTVYFGLYRLKNMSLDATKLEACARIIGIDDVTKLSTYLDIFVKYGLFQKDGNIYTCHKVTEDVLGLSKKRLKWRTSQRRHRDVNKTSLSCHHDNAVTSEEEKEEEEEQEEVKEKDLGRESPRGKPPPKAKPAKRPLETQTCEIPSHFDQPDVRRLLGAWQVARHQKHRIWLTEGSVKFNLRKFRETEIESLKYALEQAEANAWQGLFRPEELRQSANSPPQKQTQPSQERFADLAKKLNEKYS